MSLPFRAILLLLAPLPALVVGVLVMRRSGVTPGIWGQQLVAGLILAAACAVTCLWRRPTTQRGSEARRIIAAAAVLLMLALTLLHPGVDGVRRWVSLGPLQLHAGFIALPVLILAGTAPRSNSSRASWIAGAGIVIAAALLAFQPDASQVIALGLALVVVLLQRKQPSRMDWLAAAVCVGASVLALSREDPLEAVPHVEGIVSLAARTGSAWLVAAISALMLLPVPFVAIWLRHRDHHEGLGLAAYFVTVCIAAFVAPFPVPVLGYGLSPILGYFVALGWIVRTDALRSLATTGETRRNRA